MAKVLCVLYDDPVTGYPKSYARDGLPTIERYPDGQTLPTPKGIDFVPGSLLGSVSGELGLRKYLESNGHTLVVTSSKDGADSVLDKPPSAELRPDQRDEQSLPPYEKLDPVLQGYVEGDQTAADLVAGLEVFPERMRAAIGQTNGLAYSSAVLADLLESGTERERAYRAVQAAANGAIRAGGDFATLLHAEGIDVGPLRPERYLVHHDVILKRLETLRDVGHQA